MVLASLLMVALLGCAGLAVDYGVLVADKNRLQRAADAGALSGAAWLQRTGDPAVDNSNATNQAVKVALANGLESSEVRAGDVLITENNTKLRLTTRRNRTLFFMRVLGVDSQNLSAHSTATITGRFTPRALPIGITPQTLSAFNANTTVRELTLTRLQSTNFIRTDIPQFDPFVLTDFRNAGDDGTHGSPAQMQRQIAGEDVEEIKIGDSPSSIRANSQEDKFKEGIGALFARAAGAPWNDPPTGANVTPWRTVGNQFENIRSGSAPADNPRVVNLFVTDSVLSQNGNFNYPIKQFAPVYIESVTTDALGFTKMQVRFFPPTSGFASQPVALVDDIN
jgi:Flp pilus assembly protein TadG